MLEMSKLQSVRKFIRETLNLSDTAQIIDFGIKTEAGSLKVSATITQEVDISKLAAIAPSLTQPVGNERSKYKARPRKEKGESTGEFSYRREFNKTASDFSSIRVILRGWRKLGMLQTPELEKMGSFAGKFFISMSEEEKNDFLNFFNGIKEEVIKGNRSKVKREQEPEG